MAATTRSDCGGIFVINATLDLDAFAANDSADYTVTVPGILVNDVVTQVILPAAADDDVVFSHARVTAANTVVMRLANVGAGTPDPASGVYTFVVCRR